MVVVVDVVNVFIDFVEYLLIIFRDYTRNPYLQWINHDVLSLSLESRNKWSTVHYRTAIVRKWRTFFYLVNWI